MADWQSYPEVTPATGNAVDFVEGPAPKVNMDWQSYPVVEPKNPQGEAFKGQELSMPRAPDGSLYKTYEPGWREKAASAGQAMLEGTAPILDGLTWLPRVVAGEFGATDIAPSTIMEKKGIIGNMNLEPTTKAGRAGYNGVRGVTEGIPFGPAGMVGGLLASEGSGIAKEAGMGPGMQTAAGVVGGLGAGIPSALAREAFMAKDIPQILKDYEKIGVTPRLAGDIVESPFIKRLQQGVGILPGGASKIENAAKKTTSEFTGAVDNAATSSVGQKIQDAGQALIDGGQRWLGKFKAEQKTSYDDLDQYFTRPTVVPANPGVTTTTPAKTTTNSLGLNPVTTPAKTVTTGATPKQVIPGDIVKMDNFANVVRGNQNVMVDAPVLANDINQAFIKTLNRSLTKEIEPNGGLSYDSVKRLRTEIGDRMSDPTNLDQTSRATYTRLYAALSQDLEQAFTAKGPKALAEWQVANAKSTAGYALMDDAMKAVLRKNPEATNIFQVAMSSPEKLAKMKPQYEPAEWEVIQNSVMRNLGKANPWAQNAEGAAFSVSTFGTNWAKLLKDGHADVLYPKGEPMRDSLDALARVAMNMKSTNKYANTSNTAAANAIWDLMKSVPWAGVAGGASGGPGALIAAGGSMATGWAAGTLMTSPSFVKWLATPVSKEAANMRLRGLAGVAANTRDENTKQQILNFQKYALENINTDK